MHYSVAIVHHLLSLSSQVSELLRQPSSMLATTLLVDVKRHLLGQSVYICMLFQKCWFHLNFCFVIRLVLFAF